ncbi:MAG: hypothetical protein ACMUJM_18640 [bacterium]
METIFPQDTGYDGLFLVGFRKELNGSDITERIGTVILKRTYDIDPVTGELNPSEEAFSIFLQDQPDNLVLNSDFETAAPDPDDDTKLIPIGWVPSDVEILQVEDMENHLLQVKGLPGVSNGSVVQTLTFEKPLGGRKFWLSFSAKTNTGSSSIENIQLEADGSEPICVTGGNLGTEMEHFSNDNDGVWPAELESTEMRIVLRMATDSEHMVFYDNIQVEERGHLTVWDPITTLRYEHDLAPFKPEVDLIVLGFTDAAGECSVEVNNDIWFTRTLSINGARQKAMFGWEPRVNNEHPEYRQDMAGSFSEEGDDYPPQWPVTDPTRDPLPGEPDPFNNIFFNGYRRSTFDGTLTASTPFLFENLPESAQIRIKQGNGNDYGFSLRGDTSSATYSYYNGTGLDTQDNWQSEPVTMNIDTLVIEPEKNRCYIVWRGVWNFDKHNEGDYRRLLVKASP